MADTNIERQKKHQKKILDEKLLIKAFFNHLVQHAGETVSSAMKSFQDLNKVKEVLGKWKTK